MINFRKIVCEATKPRREESKYYIEYFDEDDLLHREDGPAFINKLGVEEWRYHGKLHRLDGPAYVNKLGKTEQYWVNGKQFTKEEFYKHFGSE